MTCSATRTALDPHTERTRTMSSPFACPRSGSALPFTLAASITRRRIKVLQSCDVPIGVTHAPPAHRSRGERKSRRTNELLTAPWSPSTTRRTRGHGKRRVHMKPFRRSGGPGKSLTDPPGFTDDFQRGAQVLWTAEIAQHHTSTGTAGSAGDHRRARSWPAIVLSLTADRRPRRASSVRMISARGTHAKCTPRRPVAPVLTAVRAGSVSTCANPRLRR